MPTETEVDNDVVKEAKMRFTTCEEWEQPWRPLFDYDYKFANGDAHNLYQWDSQVLARRIAEDASAPCLTINKTAQHNLLIINDAKQNKPGVNIRPVGEGASFEAAQVYQEVVRHIEYISNAENVYDYATSFQVNAGMGYWRICTDYISPKSFDQEIYIRRIKDPKSVYLDPDINEADGSDARYGFIFEDMPKDLYDAKYPDFKDLGWGSTFNQRPDMWITRHTVRVAEYYRKTQENKKLITWTNPNTGVQVLKYNDELDDDFEKLIYKEIKADKNNRALYQFNERDVLTDNVEWFKIAGNTIIDRGEWLGKYIPIVRLVGTETIIDGIVDYKGHTRALINAQQMYNYNTSANTQWGALQTKSPWQGDPKAVSGFEEYYKTANRVNHSFMPYNSLDEDGQTLSAPIRVQPPVSSPAFVEGLKIAQNEMMMVSGQYQAQMGENENAKSGVAINARQRQGDRATYHFIDNLAIAVRFTGKILIDLIPKIYDTKRVIRISASDGSIMNVTIDPNAPQPYEKQDNGPEGPELDNTQEINNILFNPNIGTYDIQSEVGPSFATKRQEAFNALTQIASQNEEFMGVAGDILWKVADFPEAQVLAQRWRKIIPKNITGDAPDPETERMMHAASDQIEKQLAQIAQQQKELEDKDRELTVKGKQLDLDKMIATAEQARKDYEAETARLVALGNSGPAVSMEQIQPIVQQLVRGMLNAGEPGSGEGINLKGPHEGGTPIEPVEGSNGQGMGSEPEETPPMEGAKKAPDGMFYVPDPDRPGKYLQVH